SRCPTRTSRAGTRRSGRRGRPTGWSTSARPTVSSSTASARSGSSSTTARASPSARPTGPSRGRRREMRHVLASASVETTLLALKIAFLVLLYLFIWRIVRSATKDLRVPQESMILAPQQARAAGLVAPVRRDPGRLVVVKSPTFEAGAEWELDSAAVYIRRGPADDL